MTTDPFDELLARYSSDVKALAQSARDEIRAWLAGVEQSVDEKGGVVGFGYGGNYKDLICTLILSRTGVKLGLVGGASLPDPERLLEGSGKVHRYVVLQTAADLRRPGVKQLVKAAERMWHEKNR